MKRNSRFPAPCLIIALGLGTNPNPNPEAHSKLGCQIALVGTEHLLFFFLEGLQSSIVRGVGVGAIHSNDQSKNILPPFSARRSVSTRGATNHGIIPQLDGYVRCFRLRIVLRSDPSSVLPHGALAFRVFIRGTTQHITAERNACVDRHSSTYIRVVLWSHRISFAEGPYLRWCVDR